MNGTHGRHAGGPGESAPREIRVDIGELALDGFHGDPDRVLAAFEAELTRLVREKGVPLAADGEPRALDALSGLPPLPSTVSAGRLGEALARSVHAGLSGEGEAPGRRPDGNGRRR
ncbi:hypothetical protein [Streptomyces sp. HNM0574]|uniref:hypothetical protein n=1 Tax=Streptomyces sp. HNM0574 TaxID=2714954 RepID=UPI00146BB9BA|nr:hypothetical protein [Streptomyces sp. HNM0574]NLU68207.1 hypothetical protein [Streptomyces sp. HNM0574]